MGLFTDVPSQLALEYRKSCVPLSKTSSSSILPVYSAISGAQALQNSASQSQAPSLRSSAPERPHGPGQNAAPSTPVSTPPTQGGIVTVKELYWCIGKPWLEPKHTHRSVIDVSVFSDDRVLINHLQREYNQVRGIKGRLFSWKGCQHIEFIKVRMILKNHLVILPYVSFNVSNALLVL
jgi:hypothetical protein